MEEKRRYYMPTVVHGENDTNETLSKEAWEGAGRGANLNFAEDGCNDWQGSNEGNMHVCARDR